LNWSTLFGDLRVAHFFGIHSLQIIPLFGIVASKYFNDEKAKKIIKTFSALYLILILSVMTQGLLGLPFLKMN
jgi:hypothetical protein